MSKLQMTSLAATLATTLLCASLGLAQDPAKPADDALEKLLEKLEGTKEKLDNTKDKAPDAQKKPGEVAPTDKDLDNLLEKLGQTADAPTPEDQAKGGGPGAKPPEPPDQPDKAKGEKLKGEAKDLDQHLEELTGRKSKKNQGKEQGEPSGPLSRVIKEMRDVEERLGKTDTGDETRKRQTEIVKNLESLIEQLRESQSQSQSKKKAQLSMKPANQPGPKGGEEKGAMAKGVGASKPERPTDKHSMAGGKDEWGHLPPELREQMVNIFKEEGLPNKADQIRRYYLSLSKKILKREE
jgi:hypothetical protein